MTSGQILNLLGAVRHARLVDTFPLSLPRSLSLSLSLSHSLSLSLSISFSQTHIHSLSISLPLTHTHTHNLSHTHTPSHSLSICVSLSHTHTHVLTLSTYLLHSHSFSPLFLLQGQPWRAAGQGGVHRLRRRLEKGALRRLAQVPKPAARNTEPENDSNCSKLFTSESI